MKYYFQTSQNKQSFWYQDLQIMWHVWQYMWLCHTSIHTPSSSLSINHPNTQHHTMSVVHSIIK